MGIRVSYTPYRELGQAAFAAGQGQRAAEDAQNALESAARVTQAKAEAENRLKLAKFDADLKLKMQTQAREWELTKMQLRSQDEFEMEEMRWKMKEMQKISDEVREIQEFTSAVKAINDTNMLTDQQKEKAILDLQLKKLYGVSGVIPKADQQKDVTPSQVMSAAKMLGKINDRGTWISRKVGEITGGMFGTEPMTDEEKMMKGYLQRIVGDAAGQAMEATGVKPQTAINPKTGERIISYDGGKTWQPIQ